MDLTTQIIQTVVTSALSILGAYPVIKKVIGKGIETVKHEVTVLGPEAKDVAARIAEHIKPMLEPKTAAPIVVTTPAAPAVPETTELQATLQESELVRLASIGLQAFGKKLTDLAPHEEAALVAFVQSHLENSTSSETTILDAINQAEKMIADVAASPLIQNALTFTKTLAALAPVPQAVSETATKDPAAQA